ncbi:hypothetical protein C6501_08405 [Candidatus Poribacteria bacterium]|nr:MAG: hypothetical protein C6501_08405 [Candidatus Poribacteria bacterium]
MLKINALKISAILFFVVSIIYMAQTPQGFGHSPSSHNPNFYVNCNGDATNVDSTDPDGGKFGKDGEPLFDPRTLQSYKGSTGDREHDASSWARRYYASNVVTANHYDDIETEMIIGARLDLYVSAGANSVSGSVSPSLTDDGGINKSWGWKGKGSLDLLISGSDNAHRVIYVPISLKPFRVFRYCQVIKVKESKLQTGLKTIGIKIVDGSESETESDELSLELSEGPAKVNAKWSRSTTKVMEDVYAKITGINASLSGSALDDFFQVTEQLDKSATATGHLGEDVIDPDNISTWYTGKHDCGGSGSIFASIDAATSVAMVNMTVVAAVPLNPSGYPRKLNARSVKRPGIFGRLDRVPLHI